MKDLLKIFEINCEKYYTLFKSNEPFILDRKNVELPIKQLISHFEIKNKHVLSIGAGRGHEEYWFYKSGCDLTFIDTDEFNIAPLLEEQLSAEKNLTDPMLTYIIEDAHKVIEKLENIYDLCYFSSFVPDEVYREDIQKEYEGQYQNTNLLLRIIRYGLFKLHITGRGRGRTWPNYKKPFSDLVMKITKNTLKDGGLFILQSYYAGIPIERNPHVVSLVKKQLSRVGISLLHIYYFKENSGVNLTIGYKGKKNATREFFRRISKNVKITRFHGRAVNPSEIVKAYQFKM